MEKSHRAYNIHMSEKKKERFWDWLENKIDKYDAEMEHAKAIVRLWATDAWKKATTKRINDNNHKDKS